MAAVSNQPAPAPVNYVAILDKDRTRCEQMAAAIHARASVLAEYSQELNKKIFTLSWKDYLGRWIGCCPRQRHEYRPLGQSEARLNTIRSLTEAIQACGPVFALWQRTPELHEKLKGELPSPEMKKILERWNEIHWTLNPKWSSTEEDKTTTINIYDQSRALRSSVEWLTRIREKPLEKLSLAVNRYQKVVTRFIYLLETGYQNLAYTAADRSFSCCNSKSDSAPDKLFPFTLSAPYLREALSHLRVENAALPQQLAIFQEELPIPEPLNLASAEEAFKENVEKLEKMVAEKERKEIERRTKPLTSRPEMSEISRLTAVFRREEPAQPITDPASGRPVYPESDWAV